MHKRVRIGQLKIGMYVEEIELGSGAQQRRGFFVQDKLDLKKLMACNGISAVVDVKRGADVKSSRPANETRKSAKASIGLDLSFCSRELAAARSTLAAAAPAFSALISSGRSGSINIYAAGSVVSDLMLTASAHPSALIGLTRLKKKDEVTFLHSLSVCVLMITLGRALGIDDAHVKELGIGGLLHDFGKIRIPKRILLKEGPLSGEEFEIIKKHPQFGYDMLQQTPQTSDYVLNICRYHHEKFDGTGYPEGKRGEEIPFEARLASICDVYDALTTIRPYKKAWSTSMACEWMTSAYGHFDSAILEAFVSCIKKHDLSL